MKNTPVQIGRLQRTHGLKGQIHLFITTGSDVLLEDIKFLLVSVNNQLIPFFIESLEDKSGKLTVKFEKVDSENDAKKLVNKEVFVNPEFIVEEEESELDQFIGYSVHDEKYGELGAITEVQEYPKHFVFVLTYKGKEVLIPAVDAFILSIDEHEQVIRLDLPEGLID